ncbi:MAG: aminotransferase class IV, partial [Planctomycetota bacterium]
MQAPIVFHHGGFVSHDTAGYGLQDRGVLFADGVYEVVRYDRGRPFAMRAHVDRLRRSLDGIGLSEVDAEPFAAWSDELMRRNGLTDGKVYWQVTRGEAARDFVSPADPKPTVTLIAYPGQPIAADAPLAEGSAHLVDDCRWTRCHIKSLMLLPASRAKTEAVRRGAAEAVFERAKPGTADRHITEGASTNVFVVAEGVLRTHPDDGWVLGGVTRREVLDLANALGIPTDDSRPFTRADLLAADEAFVCSTTQLTAVTSVTAWDDETPRVIGPGTPGMPGTPGPV